MTARRRVFLLASIAALAGPAVAAPPSVEFPTGRTNFFGGRVATLPVAIRGGDAVDGRLVWVLAAKERTLATGAVAVRHGGAADTVADLTIDVPAVKEGVVFDAALAVALAGASGEQLAARNVTMRIFAADPFADRRRWLEARRFVLVDPPGRTEKVLTAAGAAFEFVSAEADLRLLDSGLIVVGEGTSWIDHPALLRRLAAAAADGARVLCLAPLDGEMPLPGADVGEATADAEAVTSLSLRAADIVTDLDARLDSGGWRVGAETVVSRLAIAGDRGGVVVRAGAAPRGWPWLEATYAPHGGTRPAGKLIVCGLGIVEHWDETPAARYLFAALLDRLTAHVTDDRTDSPPTEPSPEKKE